LTNWSKTISFWLVFWLFFLFLAFFFKWLWFDSFDSFDSQLFFPHPQCSQECRAFYLSELKLCLQERWAMRDEEAIVRALMKEEDALNQVSKYDVGADSKKKKKGKSTKERRREQLKLRNAERQRIKRELEEIAVEDVLGRQMQMDDMRQRQMEKMKDEQMDSGESSTDDESDLSGVDSCDSDGR
jgi:hypothetical protein